MPLFNRRQLPVYTDEAILQAMDELSLTGTRPTNVTMKAIGFRVNSGRLTRLQNVHRKRLQGPVPELTPDQLAWLSLEAHRANGIPNGLDRLYRDVARKEAEDRLKASRESKRAYPLGLRVVCADQRTA